MQKVTKSRARPTTRAPPQGLKNTKNRAIKGEKLKQQPPVQERQEIQNARRFQLPRLFCFIPLMVLVLKHIWIPFQASTSGRLKVEGSTSLRRPSQSSPLSGNEATSILDNKQSKNIGIHPPPLSLSRVSAGSSFWKSQTCTAGLQYVSNVNLPTSSSSSNPPNRRRIPNIVHQTSKSRCVTPAFYEISNQWKFQDWGYYFHDDDAIERLLHSELFPEFPNLLAILRNCVTNGTLKADLWRYLVLWVYGGVYADFDTAPNPSHFFPNSTIADTDDGFFVVEQYHVLSQWFMAVSPRHPLMYYAIQYALLNLLEAPDTRLIGAQFKTGPHALHSAFMQFCHDVGVGVDPSKPGFKPVSSGIYTGTNDRSVTVVGVAEDQNQYIQRMAIKPGTRQRDYKKMGMTHFLEYTAGNGGTASGMSCMAAILNDTTVAARQETAAVS